jgi:sulfite reductase (ferredoxin)
VNGCPNSCARIQVADIGLKGQLVTDGNGEQVEGFQIHLGGGVGADPAFARKIRGLRTTADGLADYIERILRRYQAGRAPGESFGHWARRASEEDLT